jgi:hypothetical protein
MFCCEKEPDNPSRAARFCLGTDTTVPAAAFFSAAISVRCHLVSHYRNKRLRGINTFRTSPRLLLKRGHILLCGLKLLNLCGLGFIHIALLHLFEHGELILGAFGHAVDKQTAQVFTARLGAVACILLYGVPFRMKKVRKKFLFAHGSIVGFLIVHACNPPQLLPFR